MKTYRINNNFLFLNIFVFLNLLTIALNAQTNILKGFPFLRTFSFKAYNAHSQNFDITEDKRGIIYFANFAGILEFDGINWRTIQSTNGMRITALTTDSAGKVFAGGLGDFGYLKPDKLGSMQYNSLLYNCSDKNLYKNLRDILIEKIIEKDTFYLPVQKILNSKYGILYVTARGIINFSKNTLTVFYKSSETIKNAFLVKNQVYVFCKNNKIIKIKPNETTEIAYNADMSNLLDIANILSLKNNKDIIISAKQGFFELRNDSIIRYSFDIDAKLLEYEIQSATVLENNIIALGTSASGAIFVNETGRIIQVANKIAGLDNETVNNLYFSRKNILWLALNNGLAYIESPSPLSIYNQKSGLFGEITSIIKYNNIKYIATLEGLFYLQNNTFNKVENIKYGCFKLTKIKNVLLCATTLGVFMINNNIAVKLTDNYTTSILASNITPDKLYIGQTDGIYISGFDGKQLQKQTKINGINFEIIDIVEDNLGNVWVSSANKGVAKISAKDNSVHFFALESGLPTIYSVRLNWVNQKLIASTEFGLYIYDEKSDRFVLSDIFQFKSLIPKVLRVIFGNKVFDKLTGDRQWYSLVAQCPNGDLVTNSGDETHISYYIKKQNNKYVENRISLLPVSDFIIRTIYTGDSGFIWFGGPDGLIVFDLDSAYKSNYKYPTLLRKVSIGNDSLIYNGSFVNKNGEIEHNQSDENIYYIDYKYNSISFEYSATSFNSRTKILFQYYLEGFDETWSDWNTIPNKEYTNLPDKSYVFHVRSKNVFNNQGDEVTYNFVINTPLYRTWWAILIYIILVSGAVYFLIRWRLIIILKEKEKLEQIVTERTEEINNQKEELKAQSEELAFKNDQLEKIDLLVQSINSQIDFEKLLKVFLENIQTMTRLDRASALIFDKSASAFKYKASIGFNTEDLKNINLSYTEAYNRYLDKAIEVREDIYFKSNFKFPEIQNNLSFLSEPKSMLVIVVNFNNRVQGFLILANMMMADAFDENDFNLAQILKQHISSAFIKAGILEDLQNTLINLRDTQDELIRKEKLASVGVLTKGIVDRIINPLNYITNYAQISADLASESKEIVEKDQAISADTKDDYLDVHDMMVKNLDKIKEHGTSASRIVKGMEKLLREKSTRFVDTNINQLLETVINKGVQTYKNENKDFMVTVKDDIPENIFMLPVLPEELNISLTDIINNACYAVADKVKKKAAFNPEIKVSLTRNENFLEIKIYDNGIGIPAKEQPKLFSPFVTTKPTSKGVGLGLFMAMDVIKMHKGDISVVSTENEFTEVIIKLPMNGNEQ